jgi:hypothetical protein
MARLVTRIENMAFGKKSEDLANISPYGGSLHQKMGYSARRPQVEKRVSVSYSSQFQPSEHRKDLVRLIPGNYTVEKADGQGNIFEVPNMPFTQHAEHFFAALKKSCICSAGPLRASKQHARPCHGCAIYWEDWNIRQSKGKGATTPNRISVRDIWVFNVLDYGLFHKIDQIDKRTGQPAINPNTDQPYYEWVRDEPKTAALARESKQGHVMPWLIGYRYFEILRTYSRDIERGCVSCGSADSITTMGWECGACGVNVIDPFKTELNPEQIEELTTEPVTCGSCGVNGFLQEKLKCVGKVLHPETGEKMPCDNPVRATLYDVDLLLTRQKSQHEKGTQLVVLQRSDPKTLPDEWVKIAKPLPLDKMYKPDTLETQAARFNIQPLPAAPSQPGLPGPPPPQPPIKPYGAGQ